jgi:hypothetical protein
MAFEFEPWHQKDPFSVGFLQQVAPWFTELFREYSLPYLPLHHP